MTKFHLVNLRCALVFLSLFLVPLIAFGAEQKAAPATDATIDKLASQMQGIPAREPAESMQQIRVHEDFKVELVAAEPLLRDPVAVDFDEYGRMFVAELPEYNSYAVDGFQGKGSVRMLEDTDGDGRYDRSTIYADNLNYPTAVCCWDGGLFIGAAPDVFYVKDENGDGRADSRQVVFTGFGSDKAGESHLNSFRWGLDNRIHFSTSYNAGDITIAAAPNTKAISVRGRGIVFDPHDLTQFELTSGGGQHGMSMDNWGHKFVCANSTPAQTLMYDDRYLQRNPLVKAPAPAIDIAPEGKFTRLFRISPDEPWRKLRTQLRKEGKFRGSDEGGAAFGFFTGATGVTIYRGDAWPEQYRGNLLVADVANNLIYRATVDSTDLRPVASRADADQEFLASRDIWFRPVQMANAPDGTLYVLDLYRELVEGAEFLPPEFMKYIDPIGGNDRGRIYRIAPANFSNNKPPALGDASTAELVGLLDHRNGWHRDTASRLLYQRQDSSAVDGLRRLAHEGLTAEGRMTALYSLQGLKSLQEADVLAALNDRAGMVRVHALRMAETLAEPSPALLAKICTMTADADKHVKYQLAYSLGEFSGRDSHSALATLVASNGDDSWMRLAALTSLNSGAGRVFTELSANQEFRTSTHGSQFLLSLTEQIGVRNRQDETAAVLKTLQALPDSEKAFSQRLVELLVKTRKGKDRQMILSAASGKAGAILAELLKQAKQTAGNREADTAARIQAIRGLSLAAFEDVESLCGELLDLREASKIQSAVLQTLTDFDDDRVAGVILEGWRGFSPVVRTEATETLLSRPAWIRALLDAVEQEDLSRTALDPARVALLKKHPDKAISKRASVLFDGQGLSNRTDIVKEYQPALSMEGDAEHGKAVFKKTCSVCHRLENVGTAVGADLKAVRNRGLAAVMLNILDPNREVKPVFLAYVLITADGKSVTGMIQEETANSMTIRRPDGTSVVVQRSDIEELSSTGLSFMPEGLEKQIDVKSMADLLAYLDSIR